MEMRKTAAILSISGSILILLNILLIAMNGAPVLVQSSAETIDDAMQDSAQFWWRIGFGIRDYTAGTNLIIGLIIAFIILYCSMSMYLTHRNSKLMSLVTMLLSAVTLLYGGGFAIGAILAFVGAGLNYESPKPFNETLMGKMLSALRASSKLFEHFMRDTSVKDAALVILFANLLSGIGNGLSTFNATKILGAGNADLPFQVLFTGRMSFDLSIVQTPIILMGLGILKWALLTLILFYVGVRLFGEKASLASIAAITGFAYAPITLQIFTPYIFASKPYLTSWPMALYALTNVWMIIILVAGIRKIVDVSYTKAAATVASCGAIYTLITYFILTQISIPYITQFQLPPQTMLLVATLFIAVPMLFMGRKSTSG
jgi:hypothetical protein